MTENEQMPESADMRRIERCLSDLIDSPVANRCITCSHVRHNELGYCQIKGCACGDGTTVGDCARIVRRDLPKVLSVPPAGGGAR